MLTYIFGHDEIVADFVASLIPECQLRGFGKCRAIGIADAEGNLLGGLVYRNWCPELGTIEISGAAVPGTNWLSRRTVNIMYDYPFYQCGCQMVIKTTLADNEIVLRIMAAIGFTLHRIKRLGGRYRDGVVGTLTVEDWENSRYNINRRRPAEEIADANVSERDGQPARPHHGGADERRLAVAADADATDAADATANADAADAAARQPATGRATTAATANVDATGPANAAAATAAGHAASGLRAGDAARRTTTDAADAGNAATEVESYEQA